MQGKHCIYITLLMISFLSCSKDSNSDNNNINASVITTLGGSNNDSAQSVVNTDDGGYAILGYTQSTNGDIIDATDESYDYWVLKFSADNTLDFNKTYGGTNDDRGRHIIQTQDGGFAVLGFSFSANGDVTQNEGLQDYWLAKLDNQGNLLWQKSFGYGGADYGISIIQTQDLGYIIIGVLDVTASNGAGNVNRNNNKHAGGDYWALKLDASGDLQWSRYFGGNFSDTPFGVVETQDNAYIIAGSSDSEDTDISSNIGTYDFWLVKISNTGDLIWEKSFGGTEIDEARAITTSADGNFIIAGDTRSNDGNIANNNGAADLWLIKIDTNGNLLWEKTYGGTSFDVARAIHKTQDNGFLLAGSSRSNDGDVTENKGQNDAWIIKVDTDGHLQWQNTFGGSNIDFAYSIAELNDGSIIAVGDTASNDGDIIENKGFTDLFLIKLEN